MEYLGIVIAVVALGISYWVVKRHPSPWRRNLHARSVALRENAQRVHEEQEKLREQQRQQRP